MIPRPTDNLRRLLSNTSYGVAAKLLTMTLRLAYVVVLTQLLSAEEYGLYFYALSWYVLFMPLTNPGQDLQLARAIANDSGHASEVVSATFALRLYLTLATLAVTLCAGWILNPDEQGLQLLLLITISMLPRSIALWSQLVFLSHERADLILRQDLVYRSLEVAAGLGVLLLGGDVLWLALAHGLSWAFQAIDGVFVIRKRFARFKPDWRVPSAWRDLHTGVRVAFARILEAGFLNGPVVLFRHLSSDLEALGVLAFCMQLLNMMRILPATVSAVVLPALNRSLQESEWGRNRFLSWLAFLAFGQALGVALILTFFADWLVSRFISDIFVSALPYLMIVSWLAIVPILGNGVAKVIGVQHHYTRLLLSGILGVLLMIGLSLSWVPVYGIEGVLLATTAGSAAWLLAMLAPLGRMARPYTVIVFGTIAAVSASVAVVSGLLPGGSAGLVLPLLSAGLPCLALPLTLRQTRMHGAA